MHATQQDSFSRSWDARFSEWKRDVDRHVSRMTGGLSCDDLPDYCYADAFDDEATPAQAARAAIRSAQE